MKVDLMESQKDNLTVWSKVVLMEWNLELNLVSTMAAQMALL